MDFFCYHRDRAGSLELRRGLREEHWSYMDGYEAELIARGPVADAVDAEAPSGSVHVVNLPSPAAARAFALDEPYYQAGVFRDVMLRRFHNLLGRTMWQFPPGYSEAPRYLVLGLTVARPVAQSGTELPGDPDTLIAFGHLLSDDGASWLGTAALVQLPDPAAARALLPAAHYASVEVHAWDFGGRPQ